ncbi:MAG: EutN/CcmL family microcompartment protein [Clostridia bacterium]|jgi:ethanolamine utilization protein EutN|nr:EutN/CcmL family microcompartment protein [Clostridia bacterium]MBQ3927986.1 EutN/CcmL family microcompartment protein [Clostridia bacterium]MBQ7727967.1 EutN/CcmL family microcompartment protein [Clostridia bacterium]
MLIGKVIGNVVSTRKCESLLGSKFMQVHLIEDGKETDKYLIAVDAVGAGVGETVLITTGSSARLALPKSRDGGEVPADAAIVGIIDYTN